MNKKQIKDILSRLQAADTSNQIEVETDGHTTKFHVNGDTTFLLVENENGNYSVYTDNSLYSELYYKLVEIIAKDYNVKSFAEVVEDLEATVLVKHIILSQQYDELEKMEETLEEMKNLLN